MKKTRPVSWLKKNAYLKPLSQFKVGSYFYGQVSGALYKVLELKQNVANVLHIGGNKEYILLTCESYYILKTTEKETTEEDDTGMDFL